MPKYYTQSAKMMAWCLVPVRVTAVYIPPDPSVGEMEGYYEDHEFEIDDLPKEGLDSNSLMVMDSAMHGHKEHSAITELECADDALIQNAQEMGEV